MGVILDTSILINSERCNEGVEDLLRRIRTVHGEIDVAISSISVVELTHGIYRARTDAEYKRRETFVEGVFHGLIAYPVTFEIARLAGRIEGEQAAKGVTIDFEDLVIGSTALHLGFDVATFNLRHFRLIPELSIVSI